MQPSKKQARKTDQHWIDLIPNHFARGVNKNTRSSGGKECTQKFGTELSVLGETYNYMLIPSVVFDVNMSIH